MTTHSSPHPHRSGDDSASGDDVTQEFWGDSTGWEPTIRRHRRNDEPAHATPGAVTEPDRVDNRVDDRVDNPVDNPDVVDDGWVDDGWVDEFDDWSPEPALTSAPPRFGIDPLLARFGGVAIVLTLLVPVIIGFTSDDSEAVRSVVPGVEIASASNDISAAANNALGAPSAPVSTAAVSTSDVTAPTSATTPTSEPAAAKTAETSQTSESTTPLAPPTPVALSVADTCAIEYEVVNGDFWIRIADESGTELAELLALNDATVSTALFPGRSICLPAGASVPPPPSAPTTPAPTRSTTPPRAGTPSAAPTPTATTPRAATVPRATGSTPPPTRTAAPPASNATADEVQAIIRGLWPDDLEERALEIAWRESNYKANAKNWCCYGVFQIHWGAHQSWLSSVGVTSVAQLYDPATNARAALALYERSGGWGPWGG